MEYNVNHIHRDLPWIPSKALSDKPMNEPPRNQHLNKIIQKQIK